MGSEGCGNINENGSLFLNFRHANNLVIGGNIFPRKDIQKVAWISPDGTKKNRIDLITVTMCFRRS